jgi:hypothetical protein
MPAPVAGIHVLLTSSKQGVDGRDKPGHDEIHGEIYGRGVSGRAIHLTSTIAGSTQPRPATT